MARHEVHVKIPQAAVMNSDLVLEVFGDDEKLGELRVSRGGVDWYHRSAQHAASLSWEQFDTLLQDWRG